MSAIDSMTDQQVRTLIRGVEPHEEHGEPMVTCHYDLWQRVVELADPLCVCGVNRSQHPGQFACDGYTESGGKP